MDLRYNTSCLEGVQMSTTKDIDMVNGPLLKNIFIFALPLMASNLLQMLFNAADTIVVGKFAGEEALGAVGATGSIVFLLTSVFLGLSTGANVVIAKAIGAGDHDKISHSVHTSVLISIISGIFLTIAGVGLSKTILTWVSTPENIIDLSALYMRIYFGGCISLLIYNFGSAILRAKGDTKRPLYYLLISGIINVVLNLFFVIVLDMSVAGVALATVISETVSAILVMLLLIRTPDATQLHVKDLKITPHIAEEILRIGIPAGVQGIAFSLSNVVIQSSINSFGSTVVAGNTAAANIENFVYIGMMAFSSATITFTSQNIGANKPENIKKIMWLTLILDTVTAFVVGFIAYYFADYFLLLYTDSAEVVEIGKIRLLYVALFLFLNGILDVFVNSMRGMSYSTPPTIIMLLGVCGFRLLYLFTYFPTHRSLATIYLAYPLSWTLTDLLQIALWIYVYHKTIHQMQHAN